MNQFFLNPEELNKQEELSNSEVISDFLHKADFLLSLIRDSQAQVDKIAFGMRATLEG